MLKPISLQEMQGIELNILKAFDELCRKHNLRYYMDGGTLLGAMCYEGFIPWDDDIDLKMPRPDYEKLLTLAEELPAHLSFDAPCAEHCEYLMLKVVDQRTILIENSDQKQKQTGVYIDVFPMDGYPNNPDERKNHLRKMSKLNTLFHNSLDGFLSMRQSGNPMKRMKGRLYSKMYTPWSMAQRLRKEAMKYNYDSSDEVGLLIEGNAQKECFRKEWLQDGFALEFEERMFPAPSGYREHMVIFYGDHVIKPECYHNLPQYPSQHEHEVYWKEVNL